MSQETNDGYAYHVGANVTYCDSCGRVVYVGLKGYDIDPVDLARAMDRHLTKFHIHETDIIVTEG